MQSAARSSSEIDTIGLPGGAHWHPFHPKPKRLGSASHPTLFGLLGGEEPRIPGSERLRGVGGEDHPYDPYEKHLGPTLIKLWGATA